MGWTQITSIVKGVHLHFAKTLGGAQISLIKIEKSPRPTSDIF